MSRESCRMSGVRRQGNRWEMPIGGTELVLSIRRWNKGMEGGDGGFEALEETLEASPQTVDRA